MRYLLFLTLLVGCGTDPVNPNNQSPVNEDALEIEGTWSSNFDSDETITITSWDVSADWGESTTAIVDWSNEDNWVITQNSEDSEYSPSAYNLVVWTEIDSGSFYYCMVDYGIETEEAARLSDVEFDSTNPSESGCGDFSWTQLTRAE